MALHIVDQATPSRPLNVEQIVKKAQNFDYNPLIPLRYWLRTAGTLLKEVLAFSFPDSIRTDPKITG